MSNKPNLKREIQPMPDDVKQLLIDHQVMDDYNARPDYQQNDYLSWLNRAKRDETRQKRIDQMLEELKKVGFT